MRIRGWVPCAVGLLLAACGQPQTTPAGPGAAPLGGPGVPLTAGRAASSAQPARRPRREFVLYDFFHDNGGRPRGGLAVGRYGSLFGTTSRGGGVGCPAKRGGCGTVYIMANTDSGYIGSLLYRFCKERGCADGALPYADVTFDKRGAMYGTTYEGGANNSGVVFKMTPKRNGSYKESVLYSFCPRVGCEDGSHPRSTLV